MNTPTYHDQWMKVTTAYVNLELDPYSNCACFIGNLLNNKDEWAACRFFDYQNKRGYIVEGNYGFIKATTCIWKESNGFYTLHEILDLEYSFLFVLRDNWYKHVPKGGNIILSESDNQQNETALFLAMDSTLDMLKKLHEDKGEIIDPIPFKQRELVNA